MQPPDALRNLDLLVVGGGVAGLSAALRAAAAEPGLRAAVVAKAAADHSATWWAQGGVAAVLAEREVERPSFTDSVESHLSDTLAAGAGLCDGEAVRVLVGEGPQRVRELASLGAHFDRGASGRWLLAREGGHSVARVVHSGGAATGAEVERTLVAAAVALGVTLVENWFAVDLIVRAGRCAGVTFLTADGTTVDVGARHVLLGTGGAGQLYPVTTNPLQSTGDGIAMALRAGAAVADVEFVQFHPTALDAGSPDGPRVLLSEALRGEGALLRDEAGERFVDEMAPRDIVAASVADRIRSSAGGHVWLDISGVSGFSARFASLAERVRQAGVDPDREWLPVAPAAHYMCGGVMADLDGATTLPGLWVAGETACSGVHGANRLASNSLLEGMVFAARAVEAILAGKSSPDPTGVLRALNAPAPDDGGAIRVKRLHRSAETATGPVERPSSTAPCERSAGTVSDDRRRLQKAMADGVGVLRDAGSLAEAAGVLDVIGHQYGCAHKDVTSGVASLEIRNLAEVASAAIAGAQARTESRGGHRRSDFPSTLDAMSCRFVQ